MSTKVFDPSGAAEEGSGIFGLPYTPEESKVIYVPVPWEATTSYRGGTSKGPHAILKASHQLDLYDAELGPVYEAGLCMLEEAKLIREWSLIGKTYAHDPSRVNALSQKVNELVYLESKKYLDQDKLVAVVGGDHSSPYGAFRAMAEREKEFGILHFDAHFDLRKAYRGHTHSHASIFYNTLEDFPQVKKLVQVGIRDFSEDELNYSQSQGPRAQAFLDLAIQERRMAGEPWTKIAKDIIKDLPKKVWVSFDIDGLDPRFGPNPGTPVPGGMDFFEANFVFKELVASGRQIIGFDLCEVSPGEHPQQSNEWDANVGMRLLYKLTGWALRSQRR